MHLNLRKQGFLCLRMVIFIFSLMGAMIRNVKSVKEIPAKIFGKD